MLVRERSFVAKSTGQAWQGVSRHQRDTIISSLQITKLILAGWRTIQLAIQAMWNKYGFTTKIDD